LSVDDVPFFDKLRDHTMHVGPTRLPGSALGPGTPEAQPRCRSGVLSVRAGLVSIVLLGCATLVPVSTASRAQGTSAATTEVANALLDFSIARVEAWAEVKRIAARFETAPITSAPGLYHLARDVRLLQRKIETPARVDLDGIRPDSLVTNNPNFWRATLEATAGEVLVPWFEAMVWLSAGEVVRAHTQLMLLRATRHIPEEIDRLVLKHLHHIGRSMPSQLTEDFEFATQSPTGSSRLSRLIHISTRHPDNPMVAHHIVLNRMAALGVPSNPLAMAEGDDEIPALATLVRESVAEIAVLRKHNPIFAALFQSDPDRRRHARELWQYWGEAMQPDGAVSDEDLAHIAEGLEQLGLWSRALAVSRLIADEAAVDPAETWSRWERLLPRVIGDEDSAPILRDAQRRQSAPITFTTSSASRANDLPARPIHPLMVHKSERALREASFVIERQGAGPEDLAVAYRRRAYAWKNLGRWDEVEADLKRLASYDTQSDGRAMIRTHLALERDNPRDAWRAIESVRRNDGSAATMLALTAAAHAREGKWIKAAEAHAAIIELPDVEPEQKAYAAFHAAATTRFAGGNPIGLIEAARRRTPPHLWVSSLLNALADEDAARRLLDQAEEGTSVQQLDRQCEAYLALAVQPGLPPDEVKTALINCVTTGRTGFVEYDLARARLREIAPEWWSEPR
jgi:tetratricopeptide (TPR) repeat protein